MTKWEFYSFGTNNGEDPELKKLGADGWELVTVIQTQVAGGLRGPITMLVFFFKRPLPVTLDA